MLRDKMGNLIGLAAAMFEPEFRAWCGRAGLGRV